MGCRFSTLLDILSSLQFRTVILLTLGLDTCQITDLLETSEETVCSAVSRCFDQLECRSMEELAHRELYAYRNDLYDERLVTELALLQSAARRMLGKAASPTDLGTGVESTELPSATWVM